MESGAGAAVLRLRQSRSAEGCPRDLSGKALINSTTAEGSMLERVLPLAKQYGAAVIGGDHRRERHPATPEAAPGGSP